MKINEFIVVEGRDDTERVKELFNVIRLKQMVAPLTNQR